MDTVMMACSQCGESKPLGEMRKRPASADGTARFGPNCNPCNAAAALRWYNENRDRSDRNRLAWNLRKLYGLSIEEYEALVAAQSGLCAICQRPERAQRNGRTMRLPVDHDHATGEIRGLLCHTCNRAIGLLQDDPALLMRAADYLLGQHAPVGS